MIIKYILYLIIIGIISLFVFIKIKFRFWASQPVFHVYNIYYWLFQPGLIQNTLPSKTRYYDPLVITQKYQDFPAEKKELLYALVKNHFLNKDNVKYHPQKKDILNYFLSHDRDSFVSMKYKKIYKPYMGTIQSPSKKLVSCMTSRPLDCYLNDIKKEVSYVDFLCVHGKERKQGNAPKTIYTHYKNSRALGSEKIFLFKREGHVNFIIPLVIYNAFAFDINLFKQVEKTNKTNNRSRPIEPIEPIGPILCILINDSNYKLLFHYLTEIKKKFKCFIMPCLNHIKHQIENNLLYVCLLLDNHKPIGSYFFRNPQTSYKAKNSMECFASHCEKNHEKIFAESFQDCIRLIDNKQKFDILFIENLSNNNLLITEIQKTVTTLWKLSMAYYFYNFAYRPISPENVFLLN